MPGVPPHPAMFSSHPMPLPSVFSPHSAAPPAVQPHHFGGSFPTPNSFPALPPSSGRVPGPPASTLQARSSNRLSPQRNSASMGIAATFDNDDDDAVAVPSLGSPDSFFSFSPSGSPFRGDAGEEVGLEELDGLDWGGEDDDPMMGGLQDDQDITEGGGGGSSSRTALPMMTGVDDSFLQDLLSSPLPLDESSLFATIDGLWQQ